MKWKALIGAVFALSLASCTTADFSQSSLVASASTKRECSTSSQRIRSVRATCEELVMDLHFSSYGYRAVHTAALKYGVEPQFALAIARIESGGACNLRSHAGALGVMQVMPRTAQRHGVHRPRNLLDCKIGAETGVQELKRLLILTNGNRRLAAVGFNCGEACITRTRWPKETQHYLRRHRF